MPRATRERDPVATRRRLLDATRQLLTEHGYSAVSEPRVCEIAALTRGGLRHHFPTGKYGLVAALAGELFDALPDAGAMKERDRALQLLRFLADAPEGNPLVLLLEIWFASRTDPRLQDAIQPTFTDSVAGVFASSPGVPIPVSVLPFRFMLYGAILDVFSGHYERADLRHAVTIAQTLQLKDTRPGG